jgi:hypothetical protein
MRYKPLKPKPLFIRHFAKGLVIALGFTFFSLLIGTVGYHHLCRLKWVDSFLNASMILGGMGPVDPIPTDYGKIFASLYALYSGMAFLIIASVLFAPVFQRFLHKFNLEIEENDEGKKEDNQAQ